jgi:hypothetical protein
MAEPAYDEPNPFFDDEGELPPLPDESEATSSPDEQGSGQLSPQELERLREQAQQFQRFASDPQFAAQVVAERARQLGLEVRQPSQEPPRPSEPPADYVDTIRQSLPQELQFLAPHMAKATWQATEARIAPLQRQQQQQDAQQRQASYDTMARDLSQEAPGWERYEDEMLQILGFMKGALAGQGQMTHPKYGSALKMLYRLASGDAQATAQAGRRMQQALRSPTRTSQGGGQRNGGPDLQTMLKQAKSPQQKWLMSYRNALQEHGAT